MLKIVLYSNITERKIIEKVLSQALKGNNISFKIHYTNNASRFMKDYFPDSSFKLFIACVDGSIIYMIRSQASPEASRITSGSIGFPPTPSEINKNLLRNYELSNVCPHRVYHANDGESSCEILHEDIEYIKFEKNKSVIYLKNGRAETIPKGIKAVLSELNGKYFVKCCMGYVVNIFNIRKIYYYTRSRLNMLELMSGAKIPQSKSGNDRFLNSYLLSFPEYASLKILDD